MGGGSDVSCYEPNGPWDVDDEDSDVPDELPPPAHARSISLAQFPAATATAAAAAVKLTTPLTYRWTSTLPRSKATQ